MAARERIVVGISGGVDSAVAALCLLNDGFEVHGLHMTNWDEDDSYCTAAEDYQVARRVCSELGIPLHRANFSVAYRQRVFADFLADYAAGRTPNPDVLCNRYIKFGHFLDHARRLGAQRIATGHYAQLATTDRLRLKKAADWQKDQTYFLHAVEPDALSHTLFPIGGLTKAQVRRLANDAGLPNYNRPDSTGICFIGERPFREFLGRYLKGAPGPVLTPEGVQVGEHKGLMFYTLGQRSGIGIGGRAGRAGGPWYVAAKDPDRRALVVVQGRNHPLLWSRTLQTGPPRWLRDVSGTMRSTGNSGGMRCEARIRHRHVPALCTAITLPEGGLRVQFDEPQWAVTPGQYAVLYDGEECLGGAIIEQSTDTERSEPSAATALAAYPL